MKPTMLTTISLLLFLFPLASSSKESVVDINGLPIFYSTTYFFILPFGGGGGLKLDKTGNSTCPLTVFQDYYSDVTGLHVKFTKLDDSFIDSVTTDTLLGGIEFVEKPEFTESSKWVVVQDIDFPRPYVGIGGIEDNKGKKIIEGNFKIERHLSGYKIVFCTRISLIDLCVDIGTSNDKNGMRLNFAILEPFEIMFLTDNDSGTGRYVV